jgi:geranylgeranyl diphosphate synthase type II
LSEGKRFRPSLGLSLSESLGAHPKIVLPWLLAVEMIHTYSLIHDDLPCMDNDDFRRGKPANHKVFGESIALLAGDALICDAFLMISEHYSERPEIALFLVTELALAIGPSGMIKGQVIDLQSKKMSLQKDDILEMHYLKTGALIRVVVLGVAKLLGLPEQKVQKLAEVGAQIGLAFQLKDDLLDSVNQVEPGSLPSCIGLSNTEQLLNTTHNRIMDILTDLNLSNSSFAEILQFNQTRQH